MKNAQHFNVILPYPVRNNVGCPAYDELSRSRYSPWAPNGGKLFQLLYSRFD